MGIATGLTAERMLEIEAASVVDGEVIGDNLILTQHDGTVINAGPVKGPEGDPASVQIAAKNAADLPATYPVGVTTQSFGAGTVTGWPVTLGTVYTYLENDQRGFQIVTEKAGGATAAPIMWIRTCGANLWSAFAQLASKTDITAVTNLFVVEPTANTIAKRDGNGRLQSADYPFWGTDVTNKNYVDAVDLAARRMNLAQRVFNGGGVRAVTATGIGWATRFIIMGLGRNAWGAGSGYFEIYKPADGTVITGYGGAANVTVAAGEIPLAANRALYYELPLGSTTVTSDPTKFRIVDYTTAMIDIPANWILIAVRSSDPTKNPSIMWGDGVRQDYWKNLTLTNSWVAYNASIWVLPSWRFTHEGKIELRGLMKNGTAGVGTPFVTFNADLGPEGDLNATGLIFNQPASGGVARVDIINGGRCSVISYAAGGTNTFVCLDNISWHPVGH